MVPDIFGFQASERLPLKVPKAGAKGFLAGSKEAFKSVPIHLCSSFLVLVER